MAAFQELNSLDRLFHAIDFAWRMNDLPGVDIWTHLECRGRIDQAGFRKALAGLQRRYPTTIGRLEHSTLLRRAFWIVDRSSTEGVQVPLSIEVTSENRQQHIDELFNSRIDWTRNPPFLVYLVSSTDGNDAVVFRWPHFFADARGGVTLIEELARLYDETVEPSAVETAGDETRSDAGAFGEAAVERASGQTQVAPPLAWWVRNARRHGNVQRRVLRLPIGKVVKQKRMRLEIRRLSESETHGVLAAAMQVCGFARLADFVRACAIRALHEEIGGANTDGQSCYSTMHLIEGRKRRDPGPVCHNLFAAVPVFVPAEIANDRRAVGDHIQAVALAAAQAGQARHNWRRLGWLARVPTPLLARILSANLKGSGRWLPVGLTNAPSMPLGFMGPLSKARSHFCGAELTNIFGVRPASYQAGFAINANYAQGRFNIAAAYFQPRISEEQITRLVQRFAELLQTPGDR